MSPGAGVKVNRLSDNGFSPLHAAAARHPALVQLLLEAKADPSVLAAAMGRLAPARRAGG